MKNAYWINLHYALRLDKLITIKTLKTIPIYIMYIVTTCLIVASLSSCTNSKEAHYKVWDSYKSCSAYGNP